MSNPYKTPEFKALQQEWYAKAAEGDQFKDIEEFDSPNDLLKSWALDFMRFSPEEYQAKLDYFDRCNTIYHNHAFINDTHKEVWHLYSIGMTIREIADEIDKKHYRKSNIAKIIIAIKKETT